MRSASRCLRTSIRASNEKQQLDKELYECLVATRRFWRRRGFCLARFKRIWFLEVIFRDRLYCWTFETFIQMSRLYFKRKCLLLKLSFFVIECFYIWRRYIVRRVHKIAKSDYYLLHVHPSVCMEQLDSHWTNFHEVWYLRSAIVWNFMQRRMIVSYGCFGTTYRSHLQGSSSFVCLLQCGRYTFECRWL